MEKKYLVQFKNNSRTYSSKKKTNAFMKFAKRLTSLGDVINSIE
ncbi:MAG: hypothetical protein PHW22_02870 [Bacilli bacterium]|nr:hypothetical protein [Bacilli bacterium]